MSPSFLRDIQWENNEMSHIYGPVAVARLKTQVKFVTLCAVLALSMAPAKAEVVYSDFAAGQTYNGSNGWGITGSNAYPGSIYSGIAFAFIVGPNNYSLSQIDLGLAHVVGTNEADIVLYGSNSTDTAPEATISSWTVANQPQAGSSDSVLTTISGITGITLTSGNTYFIGVLPFNSSTYDFWNVASLTTPGYGYEITATGGGPEPTTEAGAFDVIGTPVANVPEPLTLSIFGAGLCGLAFGVWRRRNRPKYSHKNSGYRFSLFCARNASAYRAAYTETVTELGRLRPGLLFWQCLRLKHSPTSLP